MKGLLMCAQYLVHYSPKNDFPQIALIFADGIEINQRLSARFAGTNLECGSPDTNSSHFIINFRKLELRNVG